MQVYEELGGEKSEQLNDLITPYRRFENTTSMHLREAPFSANKKVEMRLYMFRDLILLARPASGSVNKAGSRLSLSHKQASKRTSSKAWKGRYRLARRLDFDKVSNVVMIDRGDSDGTHGMQLTYVTRSRDKKNVSAKGTMKVITKIEKLELWFTKKEVAESMCHAVTNFVEEIMDAEIARRESQASQMSVGGATSVGGASSVGGPEKKRSWAMKKKGTMTRTGTLGRRSSAGTNPDSVGGLSLNDLKDRYHVDFGPNDPSDVSKDRVEFLVEFGEGPMGFSLGSGAGVGVIVGRLAPNSFSELAGVSIGDRVVLINETDIGLDNSWQDAVEMIKSCPRPITLKFERIAGRVVQEAETDTAAHGEKTRTPSQKRRAWAAKRAARGTESGADRLISLKELEKMYHTAEDTSDKDAKDIVALFDSIKTKPGAEANCLAVLREILNTERAYVGDLRTLVGEYILPLRRTMRRQKCREVENGSTICEHNYVRSACTRQASEANPLLDPEDINAIFMNVETLVKVNTELLTVLQDGLGTLAKSKNKNEKTLKHVSGVYAEAFVRVMPFFKMYAAYCHQYPVAIDRLLVCRSKNAALQVFLKAREDRSGTTSLNSLLIKPVQRICKYPLLFRELLKHMLAMSMENMDDYISGLEEAATAVQEIASSVNTKVGEKEGLNELMEVYEELGGEEGVPGLITAHRRYIRTDDVLMREASSAKNEKKRTAIYLFNDLVVLARGTGAIWNAGRASGTAGGGRSSSAGRSLSLRKTFGMSRGAGSLRKSHNRSGSKKEIMKMIKWIELTSTTIRALPNPDAEQCHGIEIKYVEREFTGPNGTTIGAGGSSISRSNSRASRSGVDKKPSGKVTTIINKYEWWSATETERDVLLASLNGAIEKLQSLESGHRSAIENVGAPKTKRSWMKNKGGGTANAAELKNLANKYGIKNK